MEKIEVTLIECTDNRAVNPDGIASLAENIKSTGLLQPIKLAKIKTTKGGKLYRVVIGRRRFRALQLLGVKELTPDHYTLLDAGQDPELAAFCENFHRVDLTLAEEVDQLGKLKTDQVSVYDLAALLGKTPEYIALRLNLVHLSEKWKAIMASPAEYPQWTPAKLEIIARYPEAIQDNFSEWELERSFSAKELKERFEQFGRPLSKVSFDGAECANCSKRTAAADLLFPEFAGKCDHCLDRDCYERKLAEKVVADVEAIRSRVMNDPEAEPYYLVKKRDPDTKEASAMIEAIKGVEHYYRFTVAKKGKPNAYCVWGDKVAKEMRVTVDYGDARPINAKTADGAPAVTAEGKKIKTVAEREAELKAKRDKVAIEHLMEFIKGKTFFDLLIKIFGDGLNEHLLRLCLIFGFNGSSYFQQEEEFSKLPADLNKDHYLGRVLWNSLGKTFVGKLREAIDNKTLAQIEDTSAKMICRLLRLDWENIYRMYGVSAVPEPKALIKARAEEAAAAAAKKAGAKK